MKKNRNGLSLIEVLFVLGIMAILIGGIMILFSQNTDAIKSNQLREEILTIYKIGSQLTSDYPDFNNITALDIINSGLLPSKYIQSQNIVSPYGGQIYITSYEASGTSAPSFGVYTNNLPKIACIFLASQDFSGLSSAVNVNWNWSGGVTDTGVGVNNITSVCTDNNNWVGINFLK